MCARVFFGVCVSRASLPPEAWPRCLAGVLPELPRLRRKPNRSFAAASWGLYFGCLILVVKRRLAAACGSLTIAVCIAALALSVLSAWSLGLYTSLDSIESLGMGLALGVHIIEA